MQDLINQTLAYVLNNPSTILVFLGSGLGVSIVLQTIKHFGKLQDAKKIVMALLGLLSILATFADQMLVFSNQNAPMLALHNLGWIIAIAVFAHRFFVSPVYYNSLKLLNTYNQLLVDANTYRAEQAQLAAQPAISTSAPAGATVTVTAAASEPHEFSIPQ